MRLPPLSWHDVLWPLYRAPERTLRMSELAASVVTITRSGLPVSSTASRRPACSDDERAREIAAAPRSTLPKEGAAMLRRMWPVYAAEIQRSFVDVLTREEAAAIRDGLS